MSSNWGDLPMFNEPGNDQGEREFKWFMIGSGALFTLIMVGVSFPVLETISTILIVGLVGSGFFIWLFSRLQQAVQMWHAMNDPIEKLLEEDTKLNEWH